MANRIKGITVEIGGDTTKLQTALKGVNGQIKSTQSALKDVEKLLKLDPTNTTLLAQKQKLLTQAIGETKEKLSTLKTAAQQANEQLQKGEITQAQYDALQREIAETEAELKKLESQASKTNQTLTKIGEVGSKVETFGNGVTNVGKKVSVASAAVTAMGGAAVKTAADFESSMSQVQATMNSTVYATLIKLCVDICKRNGKKKLIWLGDKNKTLNYSPKSDEMVLTVHRWFANKSCPGDWLYSRLGDLATKVTAQLGGSSSGGTTASGLYRVRKSWNDAKSQKGAFKSLDNAK